jgi:hypothetical protein
MRLSVVDRRRIWPGGGGGARPWDGGMGGLIGIGGGRRLALFSAAGVRAGEDAESYVEERRESNWSGIPEAGTAGGAAVG